MEYGAMEQYWIWLSSIDGIGAKRFYQLLSEYEDARSVWENVGPQMSFIGERAYANLVAARNERYFYGLFAGLARAGIACVTRIGNQYPSLLTNITDPPATLYVRGSAELNDGRMIAVVGSRRATRDGRRAAAEYGEALGKNGVTVVSGLARGIDTASHQGCLKARGRTVAVLGCGVDVVYPPENRALLDEILANGGSIISEYMLGTQPLSQHFPARNRIISGMAEGVLIVEGDERSGAMITANFALDQGKDIFIVPGSIYAPLSALPNRLLMDGAVPTLCAWDILEYYRWAERDQPRARKELPGDLGEDELAACKALENEALSFDELVTLMRADSQKLNSLLTMLELRGIIEKAPGRIYRMR